MYWIYRTSLYSSQEQYLIAKLLSPQPQELRKLYAHLGFKSPLQLDPYGFKPSLIFQVNDKYFFPDNYADDAGFNLYSERLVELFLSHDVKAEYFKVTLVNQLIEVINSRQYYVFHSLEGIHPLLDIEKSKWDSDKNQIANLVLKKDVDEIPPICLCNKIYIPLMREDLKEAIEEKKYRGFQFIRPEEYAKSIDFK